MAQAAPWAAMPLPQGWEARYDPNQQKYFYINHTTKSTSWTDPRQQAYMQQQQQYGYASHSLGFAPTSTQRYSPQPSPRASQRMPESVPLRNMCRTCKRRECQANSSYCLSCLSQEQERERVSKEHDRLCALLLNEYPEAGAGLIKDILNSVSNNLNEAKEQLGGLGYESKTATAEKTSVATGLSFRQKDEMRMQMQRAYPELSTIAVHRALDSCDFDEELTKSVLDDLVAEKKAATSSGPTATTSATLSGATSSSATGATAPAVSPIKPRLSYREKEELCEKLGARFPNIEKHMIQMALVSSEYSEEKANAILESTASTKRSSSPMRRTQPKATAATSPSSSTSAPKAATPVVSKPVSASSVTVSFDDTFGASSSAQSRVDSSEHSRTKGDRSKSKQKAVASGSKTPSSHTRNTNTKKLPTSKPQTKVYKPKTVNMSQRNTTGYVSALRSEPAGPNPDLINGPDQTLRLTHRSCAIGPNDELFSGSDPANLLTGYIETLGPDISLHSGPNKDICHGPTELNLQINASA